jgi:homoserine kinase
MDQKKVVIRVPATSANCGPGFDCLGLACTLYNTFEFERIPSGIEISGEGDGMAGLPHDRRNLAVSSFYTLWNKLQCPDTGLRLYCRLAVPVSRGLGSSSTAVVAGIVAANYFAGSPLSRQELVTEATRIEGHPDNVAPAILGGITVNIMEDGEVKSLKTGLVSPLRFVVLVPSVKVSTAQAREAIPEMISHKDACFSSSRAAMLMASLLTGNYAFLGAALEDRLHTPYRLPLIPGAREALSGAKAAGAYNAIISGSGSTLMAYVPVDGNMDRIAAAMAAPFQKAGIDYVIYHLDLDMDGVKIL